MRELDLLPKGGTLVGMGDWKFKQMTTFIQKDWSSCGAIACWVLDSLLRYGYLHPKYTRFDEQNVRKLVLKQYRDLIEKHSPSILFMAHTKESEKHSRC